MMKTKICWTAMAAAVLLMCSGVGVATAGAKWLITPEEAAKARPKTEKFLEPVAAVEGPGPKIIVKNPKLLERVRSPLNIFIAFKPGKSGKPPDMKTMTVTSLGFFDIDITSRVVEYIKGYNLDIEEAELPTGDHELLVAILDIAGNPNERILKVTVVE